MYKLIALDMDGTLLNSKKEISIENLNAIKEARKNGVQVIIATGRPMAGVRTYLEELDMLQGDEYVVSYNGGLVQHCGTGEVISQTTLELDDYMELFNLSQELGCNVHALTEGEVLTPKYNKYTQIEADINDIPIVEGPVEDLAKDTTIAKVMFIDHEEVLDRVILNLPQNIKDKYTIVRSAPYFLEFLHKSVNKGYGVEKVAQKLNLSREQVICMGDADNDAHMIEYAGLGVAMGNAFDSIKEMADYVTLSNDESGVAHAIRKFAL